MASESGKWRPEKIVCVGTPFTREWLKRALNASADRRSGLPEIAVEMLYYENEFEHLKYEDVYKSLRAHYQITSLSYWMAVLLGNFDPGAVSKIAVVWDEALFPRFPHLARILNELRSGAGTPPGMSRNCFTIFPLTFVILSTAARKQEQQDIYFQMGADLVVDPAEEPEWILLDRIQTRAQRLSRLAEQLSFSRIIKNAWLFFICTIIAAVLTGVISAVIEELLKPCISASNSAAPNSTAGNPIRSESNQFDPEKKIIGTTITPKANHPPVGPDFTNRPTAQSEESMPKVNETPAETHAVDQTPEDGEKR